MIGQYVMGRGLMDRSIISMPLVVASVTCKLPEYKVLFYHTIHAIRGALNKNENATGLMVVDMIQKGFFFALFTRTLARN